MMRNLKLGLVTALALGCGSAALLAEDAPATQPKDQVLSGPKADGSDAPQRRFSGDRPRHMHGPGHLIRQALADLGLSDEQKAQIRTIMEESRAANEAYRNEHKDEFQSLREQVKAAREAQDKDKLKELHVKLMALRQNEPAPPREMIKKVRAVLTAEQQAQFDAKLEEARQKMEQHRQNMGEKRGPGGEGDQMGGQGDGEKRKQRRPDGQKRQNKAPAGDGLEL